MKWGAFDLHLVSDGSLRLDGGAMFGVVPRVMWEKKIAPDERNRIRMGLNCLLIQARGTNVLIDTGCGSKYNEKEIDIFAIDRTTSLPEELDHVGLSPCDIHFVVNTHLHFDHCGGNTREADGRIVPTFPNATYLVRREEYQEAGNPNERSRPTYREHNWKVLEEEGRLEIVEQDREVIPGVRLMHTPGHTAGHQSVKIESEGRTFFFLADLCPTTAHAPLAWIMAFDLYPMTTLETRKRIYRQAVEEEWLLMFEHDASHALGYLRREKGRYRVEPAPWN